MGVQAMTGTKMSTAMRSFTALAITLFASGILTTLAATWADHPAQAAGGSAVTVTALTMFALPCIRRWILEAGDLRDVALGQIGEAQKETARALAAQAAVEVERGRMRRDAAYDAQRSAAAIATEKRRLQEQFDADRTEIMCNAYEAGVRHALAGVLEAPERPGGRSVVPFPSPAARSEQLQKRGVSHPS